MPENIIYFLYRFLLALLAPAVLVYALVRVLRKPAYAGTLRDRLGFLPSRMCQESGGAIWIHAVSVGEVVAAETLIRKLRDPLPAPIFVSTGTLAGYATARDRLYGLTSGCFYAPLDYAYVVRRVLRFLRPSVVVTMETEIWPNLMREAKRAGCGLIIANARISDRAFPKYRAWRWFFRFALRQPDAILAQSELMRERFVAAGAPPDRVTVAGNLKYDFEIRAADPESPVIEWIEAGSGPLLIAASTTADARVDEDRAAIETWKQLPGWRLILAPRKPERFDAAAELLEGTAFWRRSDETPNEGDRVLLLDSVGELPSLFERADVVFMGGTLTDAGGHNFLEPALAAKPVVVGPRLENFRAIADEFEARDAFLKIQTAAELTDAVLRAKADAAMGQRARDAAESRRGAAAVTMEAIRRVHADSLFTQARGWPMRLLLTPMAKLWALGSRRRLAREIANQRGLDTPVISVGNITWGGTGKTPFVLHLARRFRERGLEPIVLTRGYGRVSHREILIVPRGGQAAVGHTGDEPQLLLRSGETGLGVGPDRYLVGREAEQQLKPDVFLLDDGFSHQRVAREVEIVLIDSLDPFGGGELAPLGRLREPLEQLRRADIFVITRCNAVRPLDAIGRRLRQYNERAPVFHSRLVAREWINMTTGKPDHPPFSVVAFCGLGNPGAFWNSLEELGVHPMDRLPYDDHHHYAPRELEALVRYAESIHAGALVTTEKDVVNLPEDAGFLLSDMPVFWLRVDVEIDREDELLQWINPVEIRARRASDRRLAPGRR